MARSSEMDVLLLFQTIVYCSLTIVQLISIISLKTSMVELDDNCVLFADIKSAEASSNSSIISQSKSCDFIVYTCAVEEISLILLSIYHSVRFHQSRRDRVVTQDIIVKPLVVFSFICSLFGIIMGGVCSSGYIYTTCNHFPEADKTDPDTWAYTFDVDHIILDIQLTQATLWIGCLLWIAILAATIVRYTQQKRLKTSKKHAEVLLEHSRTNSDEILYETKATYRT